MKHEELRQLAMESLGYDPATGVFVRKKAGRFQSRFVGKEAGYVSKRGYVVIQLGKKLHFAHRLAWLIIHGELPPEIDHINRNCSDNRIKNLRPATHTQNKQNSSAHKKRGILPCGVRKDGKKFQAKIRHNKKQVHLGSFATPVEAESVYLIERAIRFGKFAPTY